MSTAPMLSRHLGDYLLVAQLSEDALGSVFRALSAADERRFVRLRILRSWELAPEAIEAAIRENAPRFASLAHPAIVDRQQLEVVEGVPFMTWDETSGWTLDTLLSRVRAFGIRIPAEYALLIAERIAAALEHAHRTESDGRATHHGLLWPGFVSISHDAAVRVGGFGLAAGVLPSLSKPRLAADVAPYLAPETRGEGAADPSADVYSLGVILAELLTGRRPTLDAPPPELRAGDPRSDELETFLHRCMAPRGQRFSSAVDAHREIQRMVTGNPFSLYTANLALFLYKLLNPESQLAAPSSDWESTNPVGVDASATVRTADPLPAVEPEAPAARTAETTAPAASTAEPSIAVPEEGAVEPVVFLEIEPILVEESIEVAAAMEAVAAIEAAAAAEVAAAEPIAPIEPPAASRIEEDPSGVVFRFPREGTPGPATAFETAPAAQEPSAAAPQTIPAEVTASPVLLWASAWTRPASALAAAAALTLGGFLLVSQFHGAGLVNLPRPKSPAKMALAPLPADHEPAPPAPRGPEISVAGAAPVAVVLSGSTGRLEAAATRSNGAARQSKPAPAQSRQPAEDLRLRAALARIEADRVNAQQSAGDLFGEGRHNEEEGERLLRQRDYQAAELAFSRAARLFQKAQEISWEERLRQSSPNLSNAQ